MNIGLKFKKPWQKMSFVECTAISYTHLSPAFSLCSFLTCHVLFQGTEGSKVDEQDSAGIPLLPLLGKLVDIVMNFLVMIAYQNILV